MKFNLKKISRPALFGAVLCALGVASISAQTTNQNGRLRQTENRDKASSNERLYVISAKAGGVNHVMGGVRVTRGATQQTQILAKGDEINDKDRVSVSETGRVELLLNPGSFLRLAENSDLEFSDTSLENLQLRLMKGSALLEASAVGGENGSDISITTPQAVIKLEKSGIYRINTDINATEIFVWKGAARVGDQIIKANRKTVVGSNQTIAAVVKFDKDDTRDALDIWSKDRAKELAKINNRLQTRALTNAFRGYNGFGSARSFGGYWVYDRFSGGSCFVPFGYSYWNSPYGYGYGRGIFNGYGNSPVVIVPTRFPVYDTPDSPNSPTIRLPNPIMSAPPKEPKGGGDFSSAPVTRGKGN